MFEHKFTLLHVWAQYQFEQWGDIMQQDLKSLKLNKEDTIIEIIGEEGCV